MKAGDKEYRPSRRKGGKFIRSDLIVLKLYSAIPGSP